MFPKDIQSIIQDPERKISSGIIFIDDMKVLTNLPTKINQDIKFVNLEDWKVYEHYKINDKIYGRQGKDQCWWLNIDWFANQPGGQYFDYTIGTTYYIIQNYCENF